MLQTTMVVMTGGGRVEDVDVERRLRTATSQNSVRETAKLGGRGIYMKWGMLGDVRNNATEYACSSATADRYRRKDGRGAGQDERASVRYLVCTGRMYTSRTSSRSIASASSFSLRQGGSRRVIRRRRDHQRRGRV